MISIWRDGENTDLLDAYTDHPLYKKNPHFGVGEGTVELNEEFLHVIDLPQATQYYLVFYRMDFPPFKGNPFTEDILNRVESGEYYTLPVAGKGVGFFHAQGLPNPTLTALFSIRGVDGRLSVVVALGPG